MNKVSDEFQSFTGQLYSESELTNLTLYLGNVNGTYFSFSGTIGSTFILGALSGSAYLITPLIASPLAAITGAVFIGGMLYEGLAWTKESTSTEFIARVVRDLIPSEYERMKNLI